jgi:nucleoside-diphosphate-sugar epimerase
VLKALITGGAGFIGSHLAELLLAEEWEVYALDDLSTGNERNIEQLKDRADFHLVVDSILSHSVVSELVKKCDVVYHLAAAVGVRLIVEQPVHTMVTNVQGTETVLEYARSARSPRTTGVSMGRRPRSGGSTPTRRRWTSTSRSPGIRSASSTVSSRASSTPSARARAVSTGW